MLFRSIGRPFWGRSGWPPLTGPCPGPGLGAARQSIFLPQLRFSAGTSVQTPSALPLPPHKAEYSSVASCGRYLPGPQTSAAPPLQLRLPFSQPEPDPSLGFSSLISWPPQTIEPGTFFFIVCITFQII